MKAKEDHDGKVKVGRGRWVSRQRAWQLRMKEQGKCIRCGGKLKKGSSRFCKDHWEAAKARAIRRRAERRKIREAIAKRGRKGSQRVGKVAA